MSQSKTDRVNTVGLNKTHISLDIAQLFPFFHFF